MTTESTQPQTELGPAPANGQVQSQGHRRRRRRRKNKGAATGAMQGQQLADATASRNNPSRKCNNSGLRSNKTRGIRAQAAARRRNSSKRVRMLSNPSPRPATASNRSRASARTRSKEGPARVCRPHGSQLPHRKWQCRRRAPFHHPHAGQQPSTATIS